jgi:hypothetical protein
VCTENVICVSARYIITVRRTDKFFNNIAKDGLLFLAMISKYTSAKWNRNQSAPVLYPPFFFFRNDRIFNQMESPTNISSEDLADACDALHAGQRVKVALVDTSVTVRIQQSRTFFQFVQGVRAQTSCR